MRAKKVLYFCSSCLNPVDDGIKKISVNLINEFAHRGCNLTLVVPGDCNIFNEHFNGSGMVKYAQVRTIKKMLINLALLRPLYFGFYYDKTIFEQVNKSDYDLIFYDFYPLTQYSSNVKNEVFMMPDSMKALALSVVKNENSIINKLYWSLNYLLSSVFNQRISNLKKLYVSKEDIEMDGMQNSYFFKIPADLNIDKRYHSVKRKRKVILFRGGMSFEPNMTAISYFYHDIFLKLIRKFPEITLKIVGTPPSKKIQHDMNRNTVFTGFVDDVYQVMSEAAVHIVPMRSGTGVKTKMLDSMALKRLVFCTPMAVNGIFDSVEEAVENGIVIFDDHESFICQFEQYLSGELNYTEMTDRAYSYLEKDSYSNKIDEIFEILNREVG